MNTQLLVKHPTPSTLVSLFHKTAMVAIVALSAYSLTACDQAPQYEYIEGQTMGTSYHIRYQNSATAKAEQIHKDIDARLVAINDSMSTYQNDSTISAFNALSSGQSLTVDNDFINVLKDAKQVYDQSGGAFDPTVMPLVNLWGFGQVKTVDRLQSPPAINEIKAAKAVLGFDEIRLEDHTLSKGKDGVELDFSAVAKGYAVDAIAQVLSSQYKINNYMVEIGGEVATSGVNAQTKPWQIAIDAPIINSSVSERQVIAAIRQPSPPNKLHLATSGNYRNSVVFDNKRYSHTIDPTTGQPIIGGAASVSVVAESVSLADAWATALTAMTFEKALQMATDRDIAALFIIPIDSHDTQSSANVTQNTSDDSHDIKDSTQLDEWQIVQTPAMQLLRAGKTD